MNQFLSSLFHKSWTSSWVSFLFSQCLISYLICFVVFGLCCFSIFRLTRFKHAFLIDLCEKNHISSYQTRRKWNGSYKLYAHCPCLVVILCYSIFVTSVHQSIQKKIIPQNPIETVLFFGLDLFSFLPGLRLFLTVILRLIWKTCTKYRLRQKFSFG